MTDLGSIKIYFGNVVDVKDDKHLNRARVKINGYTDELSTDELPWYYPFFGRIYLPEIGDSVIVIVYDNNFITAQYGCKINLTDSGVSEDDYQNYVELFKRVVSGKQVEISFKISDGILTQYDKTKIQQLPDTISQFVDGQSIIFKKDSITIGNQGLEPAVLGNKMVDELTAIIKHQSAIITQIYTGFQKIIAGCTNPFTATIAAQLATHLPTQAQLKAENSQIDSKKKTILSDMVKINK